MTETEGQPAQDAAPAITPAANEQATPAQDSVSQVADAEPDNETEETEGQEAASEEDQEQRPKRRSTSDRYRRKISAQAGIIEREVARADELQRKLDELSARDSDPEPKPDDYQGGEYDPKYLKDVAAHAGRTAAKKATETQGNRNNQQSERDPLVEKARAEFPDLDKRVKEFMDDGGEFGPQITHALREVDNGHAVLNYLIDNPERADDLNGMSPLKAAFEIKRISDNLSRPPTKAKTSAPPPIKPPSGGASPPVDEAALAKSDDATALIQHWRAKAKARA
jgi:hypothetical protein